MVSNTLETHLISLSFLIRLMLLMHLTASLLVLGDEPSDFQIKDHSETQFKGFLAYKGVKQGSSESGWRQDFEDARALNLITATAQDAQNKSSSSSGDSLKGLESSLDIESENSCTQAHQ
ncbi:hypothetical protein Tco_0024551 [Tanacetum coccineum]